MKESAFQWKTLKAPNVISGNLSHVGLQTSLDHKYDSNTKKLSKQMSHVYVFNKVPRVQIPSDVYLNKDDNAIKAKYSAGSPLIEFYQAKENEDEKRYKIEKAHAELKERYNHFKQERLKICKERTKKLECGEIGRHSPNYNSIFSNVYSVKIAHPIYQKEIQLNIQAKINQFNERKENERQEKEKEKKKRQMENEENTFTSPKRVIVVNNNQVKLYNKSIQKRNKENHKNCSQSKSASNKSKVKKNKGRSQCIYLPYVKGLNFNKLTGRENALVNRRKRAEITVNYNPKFNSITADTNKTFVHYDTKETLEFRKWKMTMKSIHDYKIVDGYIVMMINKEENEKPKHKSHRASLNKNDMSQLGLI